LLLGSAPKPIRGELASRAAFKPPPSLGRFFVRERSPSTSVSVLGHAPQEQ
jgi:hypothetical protein